MNILKIFPFFLLLLITDVANAQNYPFPQQKNYIYGLKPNSQNQVTMNADVQQKFERWRSVFVTANGCPANTKRIVHVNNSNFSNSEGISYGLMVLVYMDNSTNNTKADFDAIFGYYKFYLNSQGLMKWQIDASGNPTSNSFAGDGDELVAFALLMADQQWGSQGAINYLSEAKFIIKQLELYNVQKDKTFADGGGGWIFPAYQMPYVMKEFGEASGNITGWNSTINQAYFLFGIFYANTTGLMHDTFGPYGTAVDAAHSYYGYDACRVPWHLGLDYLWNGTTNSKLAKDHASKIANWAKVKWNGFPGNAKQKYKIDGTEAANYCDFGTMVGPMMVGAMTTNDQDWINTLYNYCRNLSIGSNYYADNILMINMLIATGNMPNFRKMSVYTAIQKIGNNSEILVYPNPSRGSNLQINLKSSQTSEVTSIQIYDMQGKCQFEQSFTGDHITIPKSKLQEGTFILSIKNNSHTISKKIIIE